MKIEQVITHPDPYKPFLVSQAIRAGEFVFVSGQPGYGDDGEIVNKNDFNAQADLAFKNLKRALLAGGSSLNRVVKVTIYLTSMAHMPQMLGLRRKWFSLPYPAETMVEVSALYSPEAMIEIEAIGLVGENAD